MRAVSMPFRANWASPERTGVVASLPLMVWNSASRPSSAKKPRVWAR